MFSSDLQKKDSSVLRVSCRMICEKYPCLKYPIEVVIMSLMDEALCKLFFFFTRKNHVQVTNSCFLYAYFPTGSPSFLPAVESSMSALMTRLSDLDNESPTLKAAQGFQYVCNKELIQARDCFIKGTLQINADVIELGK